MNTSQSLWAKILASLLLLLFGFATLGQLERIELSGGKALYLHEVVLVVVLVSFFSFWREKKQLLPSLLRPILVFDVWVLCTIFFHFFGQRQAVLTPLLYLMRFNAYVLFGFAVCMHVQLRTLSQKYIAWLIYISTGVFAVLGSAQYLLISDTRSLVFLGWDDHYLRLIGTLFDPGFMGVILAIGALFIQAKLFLEKKSSTQFASMQWIWILSVGSLLFTYSRASFVAFLAGCFYLFLRQRRREHIIVILFFLLGVVCLPRPRSEGTRLERTASVTARLATVESSARATPSELLFGKGWYVGKVAAPREMAGSLVPSHNSAPENSFVFLFSSLGVVGLALFLWILWDVHRAIAHIPEVVAVMLAVSVHALFSNTLFYPFVLLYVMTIVGVSLPKQH